MPPKRKKRFHGLYYHSSPPRVLPMNGQTSGETKKKSADDFSIRLSTIRIWMHEKDIGKLTRVLWAGQGNKLRQQASTNPKVKRFLAAVPYAMNAVKDVHQSVIDNSLETLQANMEPPVPPSLITCKDANGLNVIHKAAGLGHTMILEYLLGIWPDGANETDMTGKTPLHWAASAKNNMRCYTLLTQAGCEEDVLDYKMKTPAYYKQKHNEIERSFLTLVPEAPRVSQDIPTDWEALSCDESEKKSEIKIPNGKMRADVIPNGMNLLTSRSEANSIENISEPDLVEGSVNSTEEPAESSPPPSEEPDATDTKDRPLENGHLTNGNGLLSEPNSEPPTPPKTPDEKPVKDEEQMIVEAPQQQKHENVSNALNDQNSDHQANGIHEDEDTTYDEAFEDGDHVDQGNENGNAEENNNEVNGHSDGVTYDKQESGSEEKIRKDEENDATTDVNEKNEEGEVSTEKPEGTENTKDETENLIENGVEDNEGIIAEDKKDGEEIETVDKEGGKEEDKGEDEVDVVENNKEDGAVVENSERDLEIVEVKKDLEESEPKFEDENEEKENEAHNDDAVEVDHSPVKSEKENRTEPSSPPPEKAEPEDPPTEKANPEDAPQPPPADKKETDDENNNVQEDNKTGKSEGQNKENDEDDDDQVQFGSL